MNIEHLIQHLMNLFTAREKKKTTGVAGQDVPHFKSFYGKIS
jgi:hypothetical protein